MIRKLIVIATATSQLTQQLTSTNSDGEIILNINNKQKIQYLRQNFESDAYKYGYNVNPHGQFHHETRGLHSITYGCYGYVDPFGQLKATFYISDGWGYRVVQPGKDIELFLHKHEHNADKNSHDHHEHHGVITPWRELHFPTVCAQYTNANVPPLTIPSAGTPIGSGSTIEITPTRPPYKPDLNEHTKKPDISGTPEKPSHPAYPGTPGRPSHPAYPGTPGRPSHPAYPGIPEKPSHPAYPGTPGRPSHPAYPGTPGRPSHPAYPGIPEKPSHPSYPGTPEKPSHPSYPGIPEKPSHPSYPGTPEKPSHPAYPGTPGTPGIFHTPETFDIPKKPGTPETPSYPEHPEIHETPSVLEKPGTSLYPGHSATQLISNTPYAPEIPGTPNKPGMLNYPGHAGISNAPNIPNISIISEKPNKPGTQLYPGYSEIPNLSIALTKPEIPSHFEYPGIFGTLSTAGNPGKPGTPQYLTPGIPGTSSYPGYPRPNISGKPGTPAYITYPGHAIYPVTSKPPETPLHFEKPAYPSYPTYTEDSKGPEGPKGPEGLIGNEGPIGGIGGIGNIGNIGSDGGVGLDGPNGPWPTGSPGPNGPWPGDLNYIRDVKPTKRPSHKEPIRNHPLIYSFNTDKYNSISQYDFSKKTGSSYTDYALKDIELSKLSRPTEVNASLYIHQGQYIPQYKTQSVLKISENKETAYNANKINSLLHTDSTPSSLKYEIEDQYANVPELNSQLYNYPIHAKSQQQIKKPLKNEFKPLSVHDRNQYQKSIFYSSYNSQQPSKDLNQFDKLEQEEILTVDGEYNNSARVDSKSISNISFHSDGHFSAPERQVNARLETFRTNPVLDAIGVQPPSSINVKPFSLPVGPNPQACPCYLVEQNNNTNVETSSTLTSVIGQLGFIPVIFVPYCPGNEMDSNKMKIMFPSATPVPYACNTCDTQDSKFVVKALDINQLGSIDYLKEILSQTNLGFFNVPVKTVERRESKSRTAK
ncbi:hypothetical protein PUN28_003918 [Cardiocondyla obscurior]|uniref:Uncharacterized protein n=1 Tax=Cardiocondyla obscurior TaxID=286306 RepID=A0AAW2GKW2_9HYME